MATIFVMKVCKIAAHVKYELTVGTREIVPTMLLLPQKQRAHTNRRMECYCFPVRKE
jgi:hypothetical protein